MNWLVDLGLAHAGAAGNQGLQLGKQDVFADGLFELGRSQIGPLQHVFIFGLANEVAAGKKGGGIAAMLQFILHFFRSDAQSHAPASVSKACAGDQLFGRALGRMNG